MKDRRLGTDRRRSRQRTVDVSDVSYATVYLVRHALADLERARLSEELPRSGLLCGRLLVALVESVLAARRVGECVSSVVSLCTSHRS